MFSLFPTRQIAIQIGPLAVHWYGVMYLLAFLLVWWAIPRLQCTRGLGLSEDERSNFLVYGILGTLLGGRLGYVLLYAPSYFAQHPFDILKVWQGGMASHGGFLGVIVASLLFCWRYRVSFWALADVVVVPVAIGLALGRLGNFINGELYGTVTTLPWGMEFVGVSGFRHPTQIYAILKDLVIALLCYLHLRRPPPLARGREGEGVAPKTGTTFALFLILYGVLRFLVEFVRVQTVPPIWTGFFWMTYGQLLTIPIFLAGVALYVLRRGTSLAVSPRV